MGSLYSCVFKVKQIITGPPPPDGGGGGDPGGGCTDPNGCGPPPPDDDCDGFCPVVYCTYNNTDECDPATTGKVVDPTTFTKDLLVTLGLISDCSQDCPTDPFEYGGELIYPADAIGALNCCLDVNYVFCLDPTVYESCPGSCDGVLPKSFNSLSEDDTPDSVINPRPAWKTQAQCLINTDNCCILKEDQCTLYYCENGEIKSETFSKADLGLNIDDDCPDSTGYSKVINGKTYYATPAAMPWCKECTVWYCNEDTFECFSETYQISTQAEESICTTGAYPGQTPYFTKPSCQKDCCDEYEPGNPGGGGAGAPGAPEILEQALTDAYGYLNDYYDNTNPATFTKCPNDNLISFAPSFLDSVFLGEDSVYRKTVTGSVPGVIDSNTGALVLDFDELASGTADKKVVITFTRTCGDGATASIGLLFDPADFRECEGYSDCLDSVGVDCGFPEPPNEPNPIAGIRLIQVQPIFEGPPGLSQHIQFDTYQGELLIPNDTFINGVNWWQVCDEPNGTLTYQSLIDVAAYDSAGDATVLDPSLFSWSFTGTNLNFTIGSSTPIGSDNSRFRFELSNMAPGCFNNPSLNQFNGNITVGNAAGTVSFNCYSYSDQGVALQAGQQFPVGRDCGTAGGGSGFLPGISLDQETLDNLRTRNNTNLRKSRPSIKVTEMTKESSVEKYLTHLSRRRSSELLSDPTLSNTIYGTRRNLGFIPVLNNLYPTIFSKYMDYRIQLIRDFYDSGNDDVDYSESIFSDLTIENINKSLTRSRKNLINSFKDIDGSPLKTKILTKIRELIILDRLDSFSWDDLENIETLSENSPKIPSRTYSYNSYRDVLETAEASRSIDPREYEGLNRERVIRWKTIAEDLDKKLLVVELNDDVEELYVSNSDEVSVVLNDGTPSAVPITDFDTVNFVHSDGRLDELILDTQIHRTKVFDFEDMISLFGRMNEEFNIKMSVSTAAVARVEETASLEDARPDQYVLKLNPDSIEDVDVKNQLIRKTSCTYSVLEEEEIEAWVKNKTYPFYKFYVSHSDLFLDHLEKKKEVSMEYKDISLYNFADNETEDLPVIPRRIPWYVVIVPTDRNDLLTSVGLSKLIDYQTRVIYFNLTPITSDYKGNFDSPIMDEIPGEFYEDTGEGTTFFDNFTYRYNSNKVKETIKPYKKGNEILPRPEPATMALFKTLRTIVDEGNEFIKRNTNTITWGSVYKRIPKSVKKSLSLVEVSNFTDLKSRLLAGKISSNDTVNLTLGTVKDSRNQNISNASQYTATSAKKLTVDDFREETPELLE